jgi:predicted DNA-binding protein (MmcQ/YjbR family)
MSVTPTIIEVRSGGRAPKGSGTDRRAPGIVPDLGAVTWDEVLAYCLAKPGAWQDEPWDGDVVAKVGPKIFAFIGSETSTAIGLKCGPTRDVADEWLHRFPEDATAMSYIGRSGWNTLRFGGAIPDDELTEAIDASYDTIVAKLPKKDRPPAP